MTLNNNKCNKLLLQCTWEKLNPKFAIPIIVLKIRVNGTTFCYDHWLVSFLKILILAFYAWWTVLYEKVIAVGIHPVWKWASCCALVNRLKIDHAVWCVCWSVTHVFALFLFQLLKDPYFEWAYLHHFSTIWCNLSGYGCAQSRFTNSLWAVGRAKHLIGCYFALCA
jgi:hypothetical protein